MASCPWPCLLVFTGKSVFGGRGQEAHRPSQESHEERKSTPRATAKQAISGDPHETGLAAVPIVLMALGLYFSHDELRKPYVLSNYYYPPEALGQDHRAQSTPAQRQNNVFVNHDILRALYHTGRLPYDMFRYPLIPEAILLTHEERAVRSDPMETERHLPGVGTCQHGPEAGIGSS